MDGRSRSSRRAAAMVLACALSGAVEVPSAVAAPAPADAASSPERRARVTVSGARTVALRARGKVVAVVARRVRARGCGRRGARLSVRVGGRVRTSRVPRKGRRLRVPMSAVAGTHTVRLRVRPGRGCRLELRGLTFALAASRRAGPPSDLALAPRRAVPVAAAVDKRNPSAWYDDAYPAKFVDHFDGLTVENVLKLEYTWPEERRYDFARADQVVDLAARNGRSVHGHALVWHRQLPRWLWGRKWSAPDLAPRVQAFFGLMLGRYKGRITEWDVVNEPLDDAGTGLRPSFWLETFGPSYIEQAFRWADAADPDAKLFLNEFGAEDPGQKADALYALVRDLLAKGTPIDGIGFQYHTDLGAAARDPRAVYDQLARFAALGLEVQITEMDVPIPPAWRTDAAHQRRQAEQFTAAARACNALPACSRFTVWGVTDRYTWRGKDTAPLLLDESYAPKAVYHQVREAFAPVR